MDINLKKLLKIRLPKWENKKYWLEQSSKRVQGYEWHHLLGRKYSDLFVVNIPKEQHTRITNNGYKNEAEFLDLFLESIVNIQKYIDEKTKN